MCFARLAVFYGRLCERTGADVKEVARAIGTDSRIGPKFLWHRFPHPHRSVDPKPLADQKVYSIDFLM